LLLGLGIVVASCATQATDPTFLQADDLTPPEDFPFERDNVIDLATLTDWQSISVDDVQRFLHQTTYRRSSFLDTYQSNGVRGADAIMKAAVAHRINPLVLLARAQADQGLIGESLYPVPPYRVEYAFGCGCPGQGPCAPALAGFDLQVDCLARQLRKSLDELEEKGATAGGWAPGVGAKTLDGQTVTPLDAGTCALYQYTPAVHEKKPGGTWVFWTIFQKYALKLDYVGPIGGQGPTSWIGDGCRSEADCAVDGAVCQTAYPGGLCTRDCARTSCPASPGRTPTFCANVEESGSCLAACDPNVSASCRSGYQCLSIESFTQAGVRQFVCMPRAPL